MQVSVCLPVCSTLLYELVSLSVLVYMLRPSVILSLAVQAPIAFLQRLSSVCPPTPTPPQLHYVRVNNSGQAGTDKPFKDLSFGLGSWTHLYPALSLNPSYSSCLCVSLYLNLCEWVNMCLHVVYVHEDEQSVLGSFPGIVYSQNCKVVCERTKRRQRDRLLWGREGSPAVCQVTLCGPARSLIQHNNRWIINTASSLGY